MRRETRVIRGDGTCLGQGASLGEETVLTDSGRAGEVAAGVGRVRSLAFLSILRGILLLFQICRSVMCSRAYRVFPQPAGAKVKGMNL